MKSDDYAIDLIRHVYQNANLALIGDATGLRSSSTAGSFYVALMTSVSDETSYGGYARVATARNSTDWANHTDGVQNGIAVEFPTVASGTPTITHVGIYTASSGGDLLDIIELDHALILSITMVPIIPVNYLILSYKQA